MPLPRYPHLVSQNLWRCYVPGLRSSKGVCQSAASRWEDYPGSIGYAPYNVQGPRKWGRLESESQEVFEDERSLVWKMRKRGRSQGMKVRGPPEAGKGKETNYPRASRRNAALGKSWFFSPVGHFEFLTPHNYMIIDLCCFTCKFMVICHHSKKMLRQCWIWQ